MGEIWPKKKSAGCPSILEGSVIRTIIAGIWVAFFRIVPAIIVRTGWGHVERFQRNQSAELFHNASVGRWPGFAYQTDPVRSYTDMALHYTRKMLDSFAGGIYCERGSGPL